MMSVKRRHRLVAALAATPLLAIVLVACGGTASGNPAACKSAMSGQYANALANPSAPAATKPAACDGLSDAQLSQLASQILSGS